jgi:ribosome-binding protein aMBF1 (putative translation factor)
MNTVTIERKKFVLVPLDEYKELKSRPKMPDFPPPDANGNFDAVAFTRASIARGIVQDREQVGMSQRQLADAAGIRVEILNRAERGVTIPSVRTLTKIETALRKAGLKRRTSTK